MTWIYSYSNFLNYTLKHLNTKVALKAVIIAAWLLIMAYNLTWFTTFIGLWLIGFVVMCSAQYLGISGVFISLSTAVLLFTFKTIELFWSSLAESNANLISIGDYALITDNFTLEFTLLLDGYSLSYITLTSCIGVWALLFATNYMRGEPRTNNFIILLYFFLISMILLLASGNFPSLMLGWELIGCFSFLLINFWTTRIGTAKSAFKAFFFNKLSDAMLILCLIILIIFLPNSFTANFNNLYILNGVTCTIFGVQISILNIFLIGIIVCSFCKSAQFGFHAWLPDSMEAPVPASALIHSATLVSAGIFLIGRHEIFTSLNWAANTVLLWAAFTALYGGLIAAYQTDLKKILAYSTISHCGFLFVLVVYNNLPALILYLHLHGWFKSYSFMAAGNLITKFMGYQDYRRMGGSSYMATLEALVLGVSIACLGGLPFSLGFFNKHYLLLLNYSQWSTISNLLILIAAFTGLFYSFKTIYSLFLVSFKGSFATKQNLIHGISGRMWNPSEPYSNVPLLTIYPVVIIVLSYLVLNVNYFNNEMVFHSIFGIFFFYMYLQLMWMYSKAQLLPALFIIILIKLIYVL